MHATALAHAISVVVVMLVVLVATAYDAGRRVSGRRRRRPSNDHSLTIERRWFDTIIHPATALPGVPVIVHQVDDPPFVNRVRVDIDSSGGVVGFHPKRFGRGVRVAASEPQRD